MIIKKIRKYQTETAIKTYLFDYLSFIGFESFSDFYGTESDPKKFTIRFKNHRKMQVILSDDPAKSDNFTFCLYLLNDGINYEYIVFSFNKSSISPIKYVIKQKFQQDHCDLKQTIYFQDKNTLIHLRSSFDCLSSDFHKDLSLENSDFEILKDTLVCTLPQANRIVCQTTQIIDDPVLESQFGPDIMNFIISYKAIVEAFST